MHLATSITTLLAAEAGGHVLVVDIFLILATTSLVAMALTRLKLASIAGFLIAGAIIGPNALGLVTNEGNVDLMTSVAIVLLMFTIGHVVKRWPSAWVSEPPPPIVAGAREAGADDSGRSTDI